MHQTWVIKCGMPFLSTHLTRHWTPGLTSAFMWNLVMTDNDLSEAILASPCSQTLEDIRIGGDEIGFVRLSESSTKGLVSRCPKLKRLGGVVEWKGVSDLNSLIHWLSRSGWNLSLDENFTFKH